MLVLSHAGLTKIVLLPSAISSQLAATAAGTKMESKTMGKVFISKAGMNVPHCSYVKQDCVLERPTSP